MRVRVHDFWASLEDTFDELCISFSAIVITIGLMYALSQTYVCRLCDFGDYDYKHAMWSVDDRSTTGPWFRAMGVAPTTAAAEGTAESWERTARS